MPRDNSKTAILGRPSRTRSFQYDDEDLERFGAVLRGEKVPEKPVLHKYSPAIAKLLNADQPDVAAAALFFQISLRQNTPFQRTLRPEMRYVLRSLNQLAQDCPYLTRSAVAKAVERMRSKLKDGFIVRRDFGAFSYTVSEDLLNRQKEDSPFTFRSEDATFHGSIRTAVILHYMRNAIHQTAECLYDERGTRYVQMSPAILSRALGYSDDTIARSLNDLCENKHVLCRNPEHPMWYTFTSMKESPGVSLFARSGQW